MKTKYSKHKLPGFDHYDFLDRSLKDKNVQLFEPEDSYVGESDAA